MSSGSPKSDMAAVLGILLVRVRTELRFSRGGVRTNRLSQVVDVAKGVPSALGKKDPARPKTRKNAFVGAGRKFVGQESRRK